MANPDYCLWIFYFRQQSSEFLELTYFPHIFFLLFIKCEEKKLWNRFKIIFVCVCILHYLFLCWRILVADFFFFLSDMGFEVSWRLKLQIMLRARFWWKLFFFRLGNFLKIFFFHGSTYLIFWNKFTVTQPNEQAAF